MILALVSTSLSLAACGPDAEKPRLVAESTPPPPPELPADIRACPVDSYKGEWRNYPVGEVAKLLKAESNKVDRLSYCLRRLICSTKEYRALIAKVEGEQLCTLPGKKKA